jgi:hypothetical protein
MIRSSLSEKLGNAVTEGCNPDTAYGDREPDRRYRPSRSKSLTCFGYHDAAPFYLLLRGGM